MYSVRIILPTPRCSVQADVYGTYNIFTQMKHRMWMTNVRILDCVIW